MSTRRILITTALAALMVLSAIPALATSPPTTDPDRLERRLDIACGRVPNLTTRVENALARIQGGADVKGSIAWLEVKAGEARDAGREELANFIDNRIAIRTERIDVLVLRLAALAEAAEYCDARA